MASEIHNGFIAMNYPLTFFHNKPVVNQVFVFFEDDNTTEYDFSGNTGYTFKAWEDDESGRLLLSLSQGNGLMLIDNVMSMSTSAGQMNFPDNKGKYYYEMSYYTSGGYEVVLLYGTLKLI